MPFEGMAAMESSSSNSGPLAYVGATELAYLSSLSEEGEAYYQRVDQKFNDSKPTFLGSISDFVAANPDLIEQMRNVAKKCAGCGKSCATILPFCNGCDRDLRDATEEYTENVCMAFIYGIESGARYPLALSLRLEEENVLVYDDLLARGSCHLNAIPSDCHLPDWRHLLRNPAEGRNLMKRLDDACWKAVQEQFWENDAWRTSNFRANAFRSAEDFRSQIYAGVNSVPSQFQIHLQYIVPAISPADYHQFLHGKRFVKDRWLPLEYVMSSLEALEHSGSEELKDAHTMSMDAIFGAIARAGGPRYEDVYGDAIRRYNQTHRCCANWLPENFEVAVLVRHPTLRAELQGAGADSRATERLSSEVRALREQNLKVSGAASLTIVQLEKKDKASLQSYGRPYVEDLPKAASYYAFARRPGEVLCADRWAKGEQGGESGCA
eukprot:TRINITY_DN107526_c0_g1_i1.p1 TRINITY_DN107526_c0_g1~~TRINITY_DN107526_c0_g1_i1.p1  ORF type:complete len:438 (+),score=82.06 TRINITY_DN107526_c0_g1_i1:24-1337(+)